MLLDVLAQVASETLQREPSSSFKKKPVKTSNDNDVLSLNQIRLLSDNVLVNSFSELDANELHRKFTYRCFLMPDKCSETFSSFGNEEKAGQKIKSHLLSHIGDLLKEYNDPLNLDSNEEFTSETVPARVKRLQASKKCRSTSSTFKSKHNLAKPIIKSAKGKIKSPALEIKLEPEDDFNEEVPSMNNFLIRDSDLVAESITTEQFLSELGIDAGEIPVRIDDHTYFNNNEHFYNKNVSQCNDEQNQIFLDSYQSNIDDLMSSDDDSDSISDSRSKTITIMLNSKDEDENSILIPVINLNPQTHSSNCDYSMKTAENLVEEEELGRIVVQSTFPNCEISSNTPVCQPYLDQEFENDAAHAKSGDSNVKPEAYSPDHTSFPSEYIRNEYEQQLKNNSYCRTFDNEKEQALKWIKKLSQVGKREEVELVCMICQDKSFTAYRTLVYHYRSHAGIKPFVCYICNATFTRQHSLNYHMLIHNNQSRFTCQECGHRFRHPSHFKEHMRRHTGETPFQCEDCFKSFKTRNTYKRHLKVHHDKILTATGIRIISTNEFIKHDTKLRPTKVVRPYPATVASVDLPRSDDDNEFD